MFLSLRNYTLAGRKEDCTMNNYELQLRQWEQRMLLLSPGDLLKKLPELQRVGNELQIRHLGRMIALDLSTGKLRCLSDSMGLSMNEKLNIYTLLWYCKEDAKLSGNWLSFHDIKAVSPFAPAFHKSVINALSFTFQGKENKFQEAVLSIGGHSLRRNSYFVPAFACMPLMINFWDGDEEFPPQSNILFDENACDFIHPESLVTIASEAVQRLAQAAKLPVQNCF